MKKPIIGINADLTVDAKALKITLEYSRAVIKSGGVPVILPCLIPNNHVILNRFLDIVDGVLLSGGRDLSPLLYGEKGFYKSVFLLPEARQSFDLALARLALKRKIPILGICYGLQLVNVALGGSLFQDIDSHLKTGIEHPKDAHNSYICEGSLLRRIMGQKYIMVNSAHHQSIKVLGKNLMINARAEDGVIEGVELSGGFCIGVQWHPERMMDTKEQVNLFRAFIRSAAGVNNRL